LQRPLPPDQPRCEEFRRADQLEDDNTGDICWRHGKHLTTALWVSCLLAQDGPAHRLRFTAGRAGEFVFDTGELSGKLRKEGKSVGLLPVVHTATGKVLTSSMGFAGHYSVFSGSRRFGAGAWYWPSTATLLDDGAVEVHWPATADDRPFDMWAVYRWVGPLMLDVETRVRA
jgi:hypothetical protein